MTHQITRIALALALIAPQGAWAQQAPAAPAPQEQPQQQAALVPPVAPTQQSVNVPTERIKDVASVAGVRSNQLVGYGIVVGLNGTGDGNVAATLQSMQSMVSRFGMNIDAGSLNAKNAAAVMVTAELPAFAKPGQKIDITVATLGGAKSLVGGNLLMTPLIGADNETYAMAQGNLAVGGLGVSGANGSSVTVNVPTVGRIPGGASVERTVATPFESMPALMLNLNTPDFSTAQRVVDAIDKSMGPGTASALDAATIKVTAPRDVNQRVSFMAAVQDIKVDQAAPPARVIVNSRTGTIVIGDGVFLTPAAVSHGSLTVRITESQTVTPGQGGIATGQGAVAQGGQNTTTQNSQIDVNQPKVKMFLFAPGVQLSKIVDAVNSVGASPSDLVAILEALKQAGALHADLIVI
jgi:flagellar P-ring protein precursor FlgI